MSERYIDIQHIRNNPNLHWHPFWLSWNRQLTVKDIDTLKLPNSTDTWCWRVISDNININEVRNNPNKPWDKWGLSTNKTLTVKDIETLKLPNSKGDWHWRAISIIIDIQEVINNPNKPWDMDGLSNNDNITDKILEFFSAGLLKHLQKPIGDFKYSTDIAIKCE